MKKFILILGLILSWSSLAVIDAQLVTEPNREFMNFFLKGYLEFQEKEFGNRLSLGTRHGDEFLKAAISELNHWLTPEHKKLDQILIGQGFDERKKPFYTFRIYIAQGLRNHPYLKSFKLPFSPLFIERYQNQEICFIGDIKVSEIQWKSVPKFQDSTYLQHYCSGKLKFISYLAPDEDGTFPNPFSGQSDLELRTYSPDRLESVLEYVRTTHTTRLPPHHIPYVNAHGVNILVPFDKYSLNPKGEMIIYYP